MGTINKYYSSNYYTKHLKISKSTGFKVFLNLEIAKKCEKKLLPRFSLSRQFPSDRILNDSR